MATEDRFIGPNDLDRKAIGCGLHPNTYELDRERNLRVDTDDLNLLDLLLRPSGRNGNTVPQHQKSRHEAMTVSTILVCRSILIVGPPYPIEASSRR